MNAYAELKKHKDKLTAQQYRTLKGQITAGDPDGAMRGLDRLIARERLRNEVRANGREKQEGNRGA